jgi:hypothetical protein
MLTLLRYIVYNKFYSIATRIIRQDPDPARSIVNCPPGSGSVIQDYGSADPDLKEIFTKLKSKFAQIISHSSKMLQKVSIHFCSQSWYRNCNCTFLIILITLL